MHRALLLFALIPALAACGGSPAKPAPIHDDIPDEPAVGPPGDPNRFPTLDLPSIYAFCIMPADPGAARVAALAKPRREQLRAWLREGPVAVRFEACNMIPIPRCYGLGKASYAAAPHDDSIPLRTRGDLFREHPVASSRLQDLIHNGQSLRVDTFQAGHFSYDLAAIERHFDVAACRGATHVITGYALGAAAVFASRLRGPEAELEHAGDKDACARAGSSPLAPPTGCDELISVDLLPIGKLPPPGIESEKRRDVPASRPGSP